MKKIISYISVFVCAFMLLSSMIPVHAAEYDVYETGQKFTKEMENGKKVEFTVIEDEGASSKYVKVIANPAGLSQFGVKTDYSYNDITAAISGGEWSSNQVAIVDGLGKKWGENGTARITNDGKYAVRILEKSDYDSFRDKYATNKYGSAYSSLSSDNQTKVTTELAEILKGQTFWVINLNDSNVLAYDRIANGTYLDTEMDDTTKANKMNLTVTVTVCKEPKKICKYDAATKKYYGAKGDVVTAAEYKKQCENPETADNNVLILSIIAAGCVICIVGFGKKILAK